MIRGMTGFGAAQFSSGKIKGQVEIKSLNHRYLDLSFYLPGGFAAAENKARSILQKHLERGRVTASFRITQKPEQSVAFNRAAIQEYLKQARQLKKDLRVAGDLAISDLVSLPGVVEVGESRVDAQKVWPAMERALRKALRELAKMRQSEGKSLVADLTAKLKTMRSLVKKITARHRAVLKDKKKGLTAEEFLSFQKGSDVNEELARLSHYVGEFQSLLRTRQSVGKKLDFIAQEMQRETNTIGSKLQDTEVANAVVSLKSTIEKIREQAQNIE